MSSPDMIRLSDELWQRIEALSQQLRALPEVQGPLLQEVLENLTVALEELRASEAALTQQTEALAASQQAVNAARQRYQDLFDFAPHGYLVTSPFGMVQEANRAAAALLNISQDHLVGKPLRIFTAAADRQEFHAYIARVREGEGLHELEACLQPRNKLPVPVALTSVRVRDERGRVVALRWQLRDLTERQQTQLQLQRQEAALAQREKLAAMGSLLATVAHELNNPLAIALMEAEILEDAVVGQPWAEHAHKLTEATARCAHLVQNFLTLARQHPPARVPVQLNAIIPPALDLLRHPLQVDNVELSLQLDDELPLLQADPHQLHQVLVNLVTNAHEALRDVSSPRRLTLLTRVSADRSRVLLEVADTGPGMPPEVQARIFEPFFTTKPIGVGTGLGLSFCRGIVESHGGTIRVASERSQGTRFQIELPVQAGLMEQSRVPTRAVQPPSAEQSLLIADDEPGITSALAYLLRREGYRVDTVANGRSALAKLQAQAYELILCDLRMPELDGPSLYRAIATSQPELARRFLFLTGDTLSPETRAFLDGIELPRLAKPFTARDVRHAVAEALLAWQSTTHGGLASMAPLDDQAPAP